MVLRRLSLFLYVVVVAVFVIYVDTGNARAATAVEAEITYHEPSEGSYAGVRMIIYRDGRRVLDQKAGALCHGCEVEPALFEHDEHPVHVIQLDNSREPEVVFDFFAGGAHCCIYSYIFRYVPASGRYIGIRHDFQDFGYSFVLTHGGLFSDFSSLDARFAYKFGSFAGSRFPPQVWHFQDGRLIDVTSEFPSLVRRNLHRMWRSYRRWKGHEDVRSVLAALVADECRLGRQKAGFEILHRALRKGYLDRQELPGYGGKGAGYIARLKGLLRRGGYIK